MNEPAGAQGGVRALVAAAGFSQHGMRPMNVAAAARWQGRGTASESPGALMLYGRPVPPVSKFRVRWYREIGLAEAAGGDPATAASQATEGNPLCAATAETEGGAGPVLVIALGGGEVHLADAFREPYDVDSLVIRRWEVDGAEEEIGAADLPAMLLSEFHDALYEEGVRGVRLLTAEDSTPDGAPFILAASWFDSEEYERRMQENSDED